jgi:hypothetical protein
LPQLGRFGWEDPQIKISAQEFSLQLGAPNFRSKLIKTGVRVCLGTQIAK